MLAAYWVSLSVRHKAQALALLLVVWFVAVLLYDLGLLVVTVAGADVLGRGTLTALMLANPASVFRLLNQSVIGVLSFEVPSAAVLSGILAAWIAVLFAICARTLAFRIREAPQKVVRVTNRNRRSCRCSLYGRHDGRFAGPRTGSRLKPQCRFAR